MLRKSAFTFLSLFSFIFGAVAANASVIDGKTLFASVDCGTAANWPNATGKNWAVTPDVCEVTLEVDQGGRFNYLIEGRKVYAGTAIDVIIRPNIKGVGLKFDQLKGNMIPLAVNADGTVLTSKLVTFSVNKAGPNSIVGKTYGVSEIDTGLANNWYSGKQFNYTFEKGEVVLTFGEKSFTYATSDKGEIQGTYSVVGKKVRLHFPDMKPGLAFEATLKNNNRVLSLPLFNLELR